MESILKNLETINLNKNVNTEKTSDVNKDDDWVIINKSDQSRDENSAKRTKK